MRQDELERVQPGFDDPVLDSQATFRGALQAVSLPGQTVVLSALRQWRGPGELSAACLMLALLDSDCSVWLSESLAGTDTETWLRFHTGCRMTADLGTARFVWLARGDDWPEFSRMNQGSEAYPDQSATCLIEVDGFDEPAAPALRLRGPGIRDERILHVRGLPADFETRWARNAAMFPRGLDAFLCSGGHVAGLPRSTAAVTATGREG
jgi:alpha-D-ribose 1-methylphosphonate 5-triphosphate synthase subunit PhnH